jgi:hypothetical protein
LTGSKAHCPAREQELLEDEADGDKKQQEVTAP